MKQQMHNLLYCSLLLTYLRNLAGADYELPEDETIVSKHVGAV